MLFISLLLLTLWLGSMVADFTMGGFIHLLAGMAVGIIVAHGDRHPRHARHAHHA